MIGTAVPASPELATAKGAAGDQRSDLRRQAMLRLFRERMRGQPGRGAGRGDCHLARRGSERSSERDEQSETRDAIAPRRAVEHRTALAGDFGSWQAGRVERPAILRVVGRVDRSGSSLRRERLDGKRTPELVSQDRERVLEAFGSLEPSYEHRQILRSAQWGLAAMPAPISFVACPG